MTKADLIADALAKPFIDTLVGDPILVNTRINGDKEYQQQYREITGKVVTYGNFQYYVLKEGTVNERAFYSFKEPVAVAV